MKNEHDQLVGKNQQASTYNKISVELFESLLPIEGRFGSLSSSYSRGNFLRIADCLVKKERVDHFVEVQKAIWIPAMTGHEGMLGGSFNQSLGDSNRFLVASFWKDELSHAKYTREVLPGLRESSRVIEDTISVSGRLIRLEKNWLSFDQKNE